MLVGVLKPVGRLDAAQHAQVHAPLHHTRDHRERHQRAMQLEPFKSDAGNFRLRMDCIAPPHSAARAKSILRNSSYFERLVGLLFS